MKVKAPFCRNLGIALLLFSASLYPQKIVARIPGRLIVEAGWFIANQGKSQHIDIEGLIGDDFSVTKSSGQNFLVGIGYYFDGIDRSRISQLFGINAFYLAPTEVKGNVTQEDLFTNLSYRYSITNYPIYFATKSLIHCNKFWDFVLDLGIGPNIVRSGGFKEKSLDGGMTIPDGNIFSKNTTTAFSAMAGLGGRVNVLKRLSFELNYRFFYLGKGEFKRNNSQLENSLHTGNSYANALFFSIVI